MREQRYYAFHMKNVVTGEERIKKISAGSVDEVHCKDVGYNKPWSWTGTEPWRNVENDVEHVGGGYYKWTHAYINTRPHL